MNHSLFTYGTLMVRKMMQDLLQKELAEPQQALLRGYRKYPSSYGYPFIIADNSSDVKGILWGGLTDHDLKILDDYEGIFDSPPLYFRQFEEVYISQKCQKEIKAWIYVGNPIFFGKA
ncbi:gamma-glutamylcyclotransferase, putative [Heliorestis convoluta]|uniref:Putative gamma-glutamylcyclotransferase n=2 Tax=Heliorestis convoluta TaxID=356322 RepID=A0A5Q2N3U3_9FIRM|nr:gamma-glutamylcyclotransferase, putative [Heliorestis convoluta]